MRLTARAVYGVLIGLHPRGFREAFARDMVCLFDDAVEAYGTHWLLRDVSMSLLRQWLVRPREEGASAEAEGQFCLLAGIYPNIRAPHLTPAKLSGALALTLLSFFLYPQPDSMPHRHAPLRVEVRYGTFELR